VCTLIENGLLENKLTQEVLTRKDSKPRLISRVWNLKEVERAVLEPSARFFQPRRSRPPMKTTRKFSNGWTNVARAGPASLARRPHTA